MSAEKLTGAVYGTIVGTAVVAATGMSTGDDEKRILAAVVVTNVVFWAAHVFSRVLAVSMERQRSLSAAERREVASADWPMMAAIVPLAVPLLLGVLGVLTQRQAAWTAMWVGVVVLGAIGFGIGRVEGRSVWRSFLLSMVTAGFGFVIIVLKAAIQHH